MNPVAVDEVDIYHKTEAKELNIAIFTIMHSKLDFYFYRMTGIC